MLTRRNRESTSKRMKWKTLCCCCYFVDSLSSFALFFSPSVSLVPFSRSLEVNKCEMHGEKTHIIETNLMLIQQRVRFFVHFVISKIKLNPHTEFQCLLEKTYTQLIRYRARSFAVCPFRSDFFSRSSFKGNFRFFSRCQIDFDASFVRQNNLIGNKCYTMFLFFSEPPIGSLLLRFSPRP